MKKKPIVCIIGRPNVGKSTLFNRIAKKRIAIVEDIPGVTRDRNYHDVEWEDKEFTIVDTGGFESETGKGSLEASMVEQTGIAAAEADRVIFLLDGQTGPIADDFVIMDMLRRHEKPVYIAVNKIDAPSHEKILLDFYQLGVDEVFPVSAAHGRGVDDLLDTVTEGFASTAHQDSPEEIDEDSIPIKVAIVGRPNVGKSSLVNKICGENRVVASEVPGTTRDTIHTPVRREGRDFILLDTAGIRRKSKAYSENLERYSVFRSITAIEEAHVVILMLDATEGITDQDLKVASYAWEAGKPIIIAVNKWDLVAKETMTYREFEKDIEHRFKFSTKPIILFISALSGQRVVKLFDLARSLYEKTRFRVNTNELNELIQSATAKHAPPAAHTGGKRLKFYYVTQISRHPFIIVIFCNYPDSVHFSYKRYLTNVVREAYSLYNVPVILKFRKRASSDREQTEK